MTRNPLILGEQLESIPVAFIASLTLPCHPLQLKETLVFSVRIYILTSYIAILGDLCFFFSF